MTEQHDWHCRLSFMAKDWRIEKVEWGRKLIHLVGRNYYTGEICKTAVDVRRMNWDDYCKTALEWDIQRREGRTL